MTKVNPDNRNKTKSVIVPCDIFKSDVTYFFLSKNIKVFQLLSKSNFSVL